MTFTNTDCVHRSWRSDGWWQLEGTVWRKVYLEMENQVYKQINPIKYKIKQEIKK